MRGWLFVLCYCTFIFHVHFCNEERSSKNARECSEVTEGESECCADYIWNSSSSACEKCKPGYMDINCSKQCHKGFYGEDCDKQCNCTNCHHVTGECFTTFTDAGSTETLKISSFLELELKKDSTNKNMFRTIIIIFGSVIILTLFCFLLVHVYRMHKRESVLVRAQNVEQCFEAQETPVYEQINELNMLSNVIEERQVEI